MKTIDAATEQLPLQPAAEATSPAKPAKAPKKDALATVPTVSEAPPNNLLTVIARAATDPNFDADKMQRLLEMQERWEMNEARKAFSVAFAAFKAEAVTITKNTTVKSGPLENTKYANLFDVVDAVIPAMSKHGLSHSWKLTKDDREWMEVTCTIRHELGHSESVSMGAAPDTGPGRNAIQARGSAKSYLERYTLLAATGMAAGSTDDDGAGGEAEGMEETAYVAHMDSIEGAPNTDSLREIFALAIEAAEEAKDPKAKDAFIKAKNKRYRELTNTK